MGVFKWLAVAVAVLLAWRWLSGAFGASGSAYMGGALPPMYGGNPGYVPMGPGMVHSPWLGFQVHATPQQWSGGSFALNGNGGAQFGYGGADINFGF